MTAQDQFCDVYGFDEEVRNTTTYCAGYALSHSYHLGRHEPQLLQLVPQPVKAVVLLFPISEYEAARKEEDVQIREKGQHPIDETILWIKQTVRFASIRQYLR